jgi:tryptophan-rich sensory protein
MRRRSVLQASACVGGAAVAGNAFIGRPAMAWFRGLTAPRWQLPMPAFLVVGALYYGLIGYVLARSIDRRDARSTAWSGVVLVGNEAWNGAFFGRRSARAGFVGCALAQRPRPLHGLRTPLRPAVDVPAVATEPGTRAEAPPATGD